jgi:hypothetical protein
MSVAFLLSAFAGTLAATLRSLGLGFVAMLAVGYVSGVIRARYLGVFTNFMFDGAVLGLYLGFLVKHFGQTPPVRTGAVYFVAFLIAWPAALTLIPVNHFLIQLVALRATVWYLPTFLIATRLRSADLVVMARGLAVLNLMTLAVGLYLYRYGIEALYPYNAITVLIYKSLDVVGSKYHRIPSTFLNAHAYGGTMLLSLPLLLDRVAGLGVRWLDRCLALCGVVAAIGGILLCAARSPLVLLGVMLAVAWVLSRFSLSIGAVGAILVAGGLLVAGSNERFQRGRSLANTEMIAGRVTMSANASFLDLALEYPMGAGMGSAAGNSTPYFLAEVAPPQIGLENEYCHILVDQGWLGLGGWLVFVGWLFMRPPPARAMPWRFGLLFIYALCLGFWATAFTGTGLLAGIPTAVLLLTQMGVLAAVRAQGGVPGAVAPQPAPVRATKGPPPGMIHGPGGCWLPAPARGQG